MHEYYIVFTLYIVLVIKIADLQDDYEQNEAIMNIINVGTQYGLNEADNHAADDDDSTQYLLNFDDVQENHMQESAGEVYLLIILHL